MTPLTKALINAESAYLQSLQGSDKSLISVHKDYRDALWRAFKALCITRPGSGIGKHAHGKGLQSRHAAAAVLSPARSLRGSAGPAVAYENAPARPSYGAGAGINAEASGPVRVSSAYRVIGAAGLSLRHW